MLVHTIFPPTKKRLQTGAENAQKDAARVLPTGCVRSPYLIICRLYLKNPIMSRKIDLLTPDFFTIFLPQKPAVPRSDFAVVFPIFNLIFLFSSIFSYFLQINSIFCAKSAVFATKSPFFLPSARLNFLCIINKNRLKISTHIQVAQIFSVFGNYR